MNIFTRTTRWWPGLILAALLLASGILPGQEGRVPVADPLHGRIIQVANAPNALSQQGKPYVVLVSLDGFRYDYVKKYSAPNLLAMAKRGASAPEGMIPSYPSSTFPNHLSLITGLYPEHHGIVANIFYDPARKERYVYVDHSSNSDGSWYSGVPLWSLAEQNQMRSACFFWPGSEAEIARKRPSYYLAFDPGIPNDQRVQQVLAWLHLPPEQRPHFITLYMSEVDGAGHAHGPDSKETADAVKTLDAEVGKLAAEIDELHLPVYLFVVADHGMETTRGDWINLTQFADLSRFRTEGPLMYPDNEEDAEKAYQSLKGASDRDKDKFVVYRRADVPAELHYNDNPRAGDPVVFATGPFPIRARKPAAGEPDRAPSVGQHGYDPRILPSMRAIFFATGPQIRAGVAVPPFANVNVYPLIAEILGLPIGKIDGDVKVLDGILKKPGPAGPTKK